MSQSVFLDTSAWLSVLSNRERHHDATAAAYRSELDAGRTIVTTNLVVAEMQVLLVRYRGPEAGRQFLDALAADFTHRVVYVTATLHSAALDRWLRPFADQPFSLADALGFEVMRSEGIDRALALDHHFQIAGFEVIPGTASPGRRRAKKKPGG